MASYTDPVLSDPAQLELARKIDVFLKSKGSPLYGTGKHFVMAGYEHGIDPRLLVAIAGAETDFAKYRPSQSIHNPFGMGPGINYPTYVAAIRAVAKNLDTNSAYKGKDTIAAIHTSYSPDGAANDPTGLNSNWTRNVTTYFRALGGNPASRVKGEGVDRRSWTDSLPGPVGAVAETVTDVAGGTARVISALFDWHFWARVAMGISGIGLLGIGGAMLFKGTMPSLAKSYQNLTPAKKDARSIPGDALDGLE